MWSSVVLPSVFSTTRNNITSKQDTDAELLTDYVIAKEMEM
jgi:hypothetical protein